MSEEEQLPTRWEIELEFVQSLANLQYVHFLAQNRYLEDVTFLNYLKYLTYWKQPEYSRHLVYPNCLHILDLLLESKSFRQGIMRADAMGVIMNEMVERWRLPQDIFTDAPVLKSEMNKGEDVEMKQQEQQQSQQVKAEDVSVSTTLETKSTMGNTTVSTGLWLMDEWVNK